MKDIAKKLENRGFAVHEAATAAQAREMLLAMTSGAESEGVGGSMTIRELDVTDTMSARGQKVYWHWLPGADAAEMRRSAMFSDVYLCSANAVTEDGKLLFIDGTGNRAAALAFGPGRVILVIGANKLSGNEEEALLRIREQACGPNGKRLGLKTPCALTGKCQDCSTSQRMCNVFLKLERRPGSHPVDIILVDEPMGF